MAEPGFIKHLARALTHDRNAVLARGGWLTISPSGETIGHCRLWSTSSVTEPPLTLVEQLPGSKVSFSAFLCRRSAWNGVGGFPAALQFQGDRSLWLRLSAVGSFVTTHKLVARYRTGAPESLTTGRWIGNAHDEVVNALEVVPRVAGDLGLSCQTPMRAAATCRLTAFLVQASVVSDAEARSQIVAALSPLADALDRKWILDDFQAGRPVRPIANTRLAASGATVLRAQPAGARPSSQKAWLEMKNGPLEPRRAMVPTGCRGRGRWAPASKH